MIIFNPVILNVLRNAFFQFLRVFTITKCQCTGKMFYGFLCGSSLSGKGVRYVASVAGVFYYAVAKYNGKTEKMD